MGKRKRASSRGRELFETVASAGRNALKEAQRRVPPDLRQQVEKRLRIIQVQLARTASQADLTRLSRRIDELAKRIDEVAREGTGARPARPRRQAERSSVSRSSSRPRRRTAAAGAKATGVRRSSASSARPARRTRARKPPAGPTPPPAAT